MPWFLVSLWENSSPESYIYKVLQSSPLSLLLASYTFNSSGLSLWVSAFHPSLQTPLWVFLTVSKAQCHLAGTAMWGTYIKGTPQGAPGSHLPFPYCKCCVSLNTVLLQFGIAQSCLSYHLWHLQAPCHCPCLPDLPSCWVLGAFSRKKSCQCSWEHRAQQSPYRAAWGIESCWWQSWCITPPLSPVHSTAASSYSSIISLGNWFSGIKVTWPESKEILFIPDWNSCTRDISW